MNKEKEFFEPSRQVGADTSKYQIVPQRHFACNLMHVGRDKVLPIAYNHSNTEKIVSPAYSVFSLKKDCGVLDDYFFLMLTEDINELLIKAIEAPTKKEKRKADREGR